MTRHHWLRLYEASAFALLLALMLLNSSLGLAAVAIALFLIGWFVFPDHRPHGVLGAIIAVVLAVAIALMTTPRVH